MANNFSLVEYKIFEADFFLDKIEECGKNIEGSMHADYYFSAFLSASRSITFTMQHAFDKIQGFNEWYAGKKELMKENELMKFFKEARNYSQKRGTMHLNVTRWAGGLNTFYFANFGEYKFAPEGDMLSVSKQYFSFILKIIQEFFVEFGEYVNPRIYYSLEKLKGRGESVKDLELEVWGYNKWTQFGVSEEDSLAYILDKMLITNIQDLFGKYHI